MERSQLNPLNIPKSMYFRGKNSNPKVQNPAQQLLTISRQNLKPVKILDSHILGPLLLSLPTLIKERQTRNENNLSVAVSGLLKLSVPDQQKAKFSRKRNLSELYPIYFPKSHLATTPHAFCKNFNTGIIQIICPVHSKKISLRSYDHGQYPWGRSKSRGAMAFICRKLGISSNSCNTCLPLHIIIGLLFFKVISLREIVTKFSKFVKNMLSSQHMRELGPTINAFLTKFKIKEKVCFRTIVYISDKFIPLKNYFGSFDKQHIYLIHRHNDFFLGI